MGKRCSSDPKNDTWALPRSCESCGSGCVCSTAGDTLQAADSLLSAVSVSSSFWATIRVVPLSPMGWRQLDWNYSFCWYQTEQLEGMIRTPAKVSVSLRGSGTSVHLGWAPSEPLGAVGTHTWVALVIAVSCGVAHGEWDPGLPAKALLGHVLLLQLLWAGEGGHPQHLLSLQRGPGRKELLGWALQRIHTLRDSPGGLCLPSPPAQWHDVLAVLILQPMKMARVAFGNEQGWQKRHQHHIHTGNLEMTSVPSNGHMDCLGALKANTQECVHVAFCLRLLWRSCSNTYPNYLLRALIGTPDKYPNCNTLCS